MKNNSKKTMQKKIAQLVKPVWEANREEVMDRGSALAMLISNSTVDKPLYDWGKMTDDEINSCKLYFANLTKDEIGTEQSVILKIAEKEEW